MFRDTIDLKSIITLLLEVNSTHVSLIQQDSFFNGGGAQTTSTEPH